MPIALLPVSIPYHFFQCPSSESCTNWLSFIAIKPDGVQV